MFSCMEPLVSLFRGNVACQISLRRIMLGQSRRASSLGDKFKLPARLGTGEPNVWVEYTAFAAEIKPSVNLGQGFPDYLPPAHLPKSLAAAAMEDFNQYTRGYGHPRLVKNLSKVYSPLIGKEIDPLSEVLVCCGAYEALFCIVMGHVDNGDEVIIIEPFFDCYDVIVLAANGICKFIPLRLKGNKDNITSADWVLDEKELASLFGPKTKMIIVNSPNNPIGKVWTRRELEMIANLCKKHNVLCLSDEVYEWLVYEPTKLVRMASLPGMWERTITVGSAGKSYSITGWKIGWAYGPPNLMKNLQVVHQNCVYCVATPLQEALARAMDVEISRIGSPECYYVSHARELKPKRDMLVKALKEIGFIPTVPEGGYLIIADWTQLSKKLDLSSEKGKTKDYKFTKKFAKETGVLIIPVTAFYSAKDKKLGENYVRFCFVKKEENLNRAVKLIKEWNAKK